MFSSIVFFLHIQLSPKKKKKWKKNSPINDDDDHCVKKSILSLLIAGSRSRWWWWWMVGKIFFSPFFFLLSTLYTCACDINTFLSIHQHHHFYFLLRKTIWIINKDQLNHCLIGFFLFFLCMCVCMCDWNLLQVAIIWESWKCFFFLVFLAKWSYYEKKIWTWNRKENSGHRDHYTW